MPESSDGPKGHRAARRERDRFFEKTVIKMGLRTFCKESRLIELIEKAVQVSSQVTWEASLLVSFHVLRCLESGIDVEPLEQSFWDRCISAIANGDKGIGMNASEELKESFHLYAQLRPHEYVPVKREGYMNHIFLGLRQTMLTNFKTVFVETFHTVVKMSTKRALEAMVDAAMDSTQLDAMLGFLKDMSREQDTLLRELENKKMKLDARYVEVVLSVIAGDTVCLTWNVLM